MSSYTLTGANLSSAGAYSPSGLPTAADTLTINGSVVVTGISNAGSVVIDSTAGQVTLIGGTFNGNFTFTGGNGEAISTQTAHPTVINGSVTMAANVTISGGTFNGQVDNSAGTITGGNFRGKLILPINLGTASVLGPAYTADSPAILLGDVHAIGPWPITATHVGPYAITPDHLGPFKVR